MTCYCGCSDDEHEGLDGEPTRLGAACENCGTDPRRGNYCGGYAPEVEAEPPAIYSGRLTDHVPRGKVPTSQEAFDSINGKPRTMAQKMVLDYVIVGDTRGRTCDEAEVALGLSHQNCSARFNDLFRAGIIERSGMQRPTRSGRGADVWKLAPGIVIPEQKGYRF